MALSIIIITLVGAFILSSLVKKKREILSWIASSASVIELVATLVVVYQVSQNGIYALNSYLAVDQLGAILILIVSVIGLAASWYSNSYLQIEVAHEVIGFRRVKQYFLLLHLFILAMFFAIVTTNPILMWISIEATTLSTAFLISFYGKPAAIEAAWKYLMINSVGLLLGFFGTLLFFYPSLNASFHELISWQVILDNVYGFDPFVAKIAFIFVLIGYGTKVGLVPMHTWLPDAHSKAPVPISSLLSGVLLNVAFLAVLRFKVITDLAVGAEFTQKLLILFGLLSVLVPAFIIFTQKNYKRLLAYSSIEHMGIAALGFGFGGAGSFAALLHMVYHSLSKSILFLSSGNIFLRYGSTKIKNVQGVLKTLPVTGGLFIIGFLAITGMPPFGIFLTEFSIMAAGIKAHPLIVAISLLALTLVFVGFLKQLTAMMFGEADKEIKKGEAGKGTLLPIIVLVIILVVASFYIPAVLKSLITSATLAY